MLKVFWYFIVTASLSVFFSAILDDNGTLIIDWFDYQISTDVFTVLLILILSFFFFTFLFHLLLRLLSIKFPFLLKTFFKKTYTTKIEQSLKRQLKGYESLTNILLALQNQNSDLAKFHYQDFNFHIKNQDLNLVLQANIALLNQDFSLAEKSLKNLSNNNDSAKVLLIFSKLKNYLQQNHQASAIIFANQILQIQPFHLPTIKILIDIYQQNNMLQPLQNLINQKKSFIIKNNLMLNSEIAKIKTQQSWQYFKKKQNFLAIAMAKQALAIFPNLFLAEKIIIKSYLSLGLKTIANNYLCSFFRKNPNYYLIKWHYFLHKKNSYQNQLKLAKNFSKNSGIFIDFTIGYVAFKNSDFNLACTHLLKFLQIEKSNQAYILLAYAYKNLDNLNLYQQYKNLAKETSLIL